LEHENFSYGCYKRLAVDSDGIHDLSYMAGGKVQPIFTDQRGAERRRRLTGARGGAGAFWREFLKKSSFWADFTRFGRDFAQKSVIFEVFGARVPEAIATGGFSKKGYALV
jgi:hypothetical protein